LVSARPLVWRLSPPPPSSSSLPSSRFGVSVPLGGVPEHDAVVAVEEGECGGGDHLGERDAPQEGCHRKVAAGRHLRSRGAKAGSGSEGRGEGGGDSSNHSDLDRLAQAILPGHALIVRKDTTARHVDVGGVLTGRWVGRFRGQGKFWLGKKFKDRFFHWLEMPFVGWTILTHHLSQSSPVYAQHTGHEKNYFSTFLWAWHICIFTYFIAHMTGNKGHAYVYLIQVGAY